MLLKIKKFILSATILGLFAAPVLVGAPAYADSTAGNSPAINTNLCNGSNFTINATNSGTPNDTGSCNDNTSTGLGPKVAHLINIFSAIIGIAAVVIIIYAGFRYVTSAGSQEGVKAAKDAIIYAVVGLIVVALAQAIVHFVINGINS